MRTVPTRTIAVCSCPTDGANSTATLGGAADASFAVGTATKVAAIAAQPAREYETNRRRISYLESRDACDVQRIVTLHTSTLVPRPRIRFLP